jgi:hypothetical protein
MLIMQGGAKLGTKNRLAPAPAAPAPWLLQRCRRGTPVVSNSSNKVDTRNSGKGQVQAVLRRQRLAFWSLQIVRTPRLPLV